MNITHPNFIDYVSLDNDGRNFVKDIKRVLRKSGYRLFLRGGNPNRKQFIGTSLTTPSGFTYKKDRYSLRANCPLVFSTYARMYLRETGKGNVSFDHCRDLIESIRLHYYSAGKSLKDTVPSNLK